MEHHVEHAQTDVHIGAYGKVAFHTGELYTFVSNTAVILVFVALLLSPVAAHAALGLFGGGDGSIATPYLVEDAYDLDAIRNPVNLNKHYRLVYDINLTIIIGVSWPTDGWLPIGDYSTPFMGSFDGGGKTISGLWINRAAPTDTYAGLFGCIKNAIIENLNVTIATSVTGRRCVGGITGGVLVEAYQISRIHNCHVSGNISGSNNFIGGLTGVVYAQNNGSNGDITNCSFTGTVTGAEWVGGLVGIQQTVTAGNSKIEQSFASGQVIATNNTAGGLVGAQTADTSNCIITACYARCTVQGNYLVGGLTGQQNATNNGNNSITRCYATGNVTAVQNRAGGLVGQQSADINSQNSINDCYSTGNVNGDGRVGGLVGHQLANNTSINSITNGYSTGSVTSTSISDEGTGGITGFQDARSSSDENRIHNCFSTSNVGGMGSNVGGLVGGQQYIVASSLIISDSYRYQLATVNGAPIPITDPNHGHNRRHGDVSTSAVQFMTQATYASNGWGFSSSGPWFWNNNEKFPKLNIGAETYPFPFYAITYNLNGGVLPAGAEYSYVPGSSYTLPTNPTRAQHIFDDWVNSGNTPVSGITTADTGHKEFWAKWTRYIFDVTLTPTSGGSVAADYSSATAGQTITLTVTPDARYRVASIVVHQTGVVSNVVAHATVSATTYTFAMPAFDATVTVVFERSSYDISVRASGNGSITTNKTSAAPGETVTLTVTPVTGYELVSISATSSIRLDRAGSTYTFTMPAHDVLVTATFQKSAAQIAWEVAGPLIESAVFTLTQKEAETERQAQYRLAELINALIKGTGFIVSADDIVIYRFQPAIAGDAVNPFGTNGLCEFRVTPPNVRWSAYSSVIIVATPYNPNDNPNGNEAVTQANQLKAWVQNGVLNVTGLTPGEVLGVYTLNGTLIHQSIVGGDNVEIALPARGVYIVKYGNRTGKVMN